MEIPSVGDGKEQDETGSLGVNTWLADMGYRPGATVVIHGLEAAPELNEQRGKLVRFLLDKERWEVELEAGLGTRNLESKNLHVQGDGSEDSDDEGSDADQEEGGEEEEPELDECVDATCADA